MQAYDSFPNLKNSAGILDNQYTVLDTIGEGRYAKVKIGVNRQTNEKIAIKIMRNSPNQDIEITRQNIDNFINEVKILSSINHKNVIKMRVVNLNGVYRKPDGRVYQVMYYTMKIAEYRELYKIIECTDQFQEKIARYFFRQLIEGIESIHNRQFGHRDIKPENILIDKNFKLKICDFGFSCQSTDQMNNKILFDSNVLVGSPEYNPPEISNSGIFYNSTYFADEMDLFASGIVLFLMVMKSMPFEKSSKDDRYYKILCSNKNLFWNIYSGQCEPTTEFKDLIEKMLQNNPENRLTLEEIKNHPWYKGEMPTQQELEKDMKIRTSTIIKETRQELENKQFRKSQRQNKFQAPQPDIDYTYFNQIKNKHEHMINEINQTLKNMRDRKKQLKQQTIEMQKKEESMKAKEDDKKIISAAEQKYNQRCKEQKKKSKKYNASNPASSSSGSEDQDNEQQIQQKYTNKQNPKSKQQNETDKERKQEEVLKKKQEMKKKMSSKKHHQKYQGDSHSGGSSSNNSNNNLKEQQQQYSYQQQQQCQQSQKNKYTNKMGSFSSEASSANQEEAQQYQNLDQPNFDQRRDNNNRKNM